jgi:hypothetical protein
MHRRIPSRVMTGQRVRQASGFSVDHRNYSAIGGFLLFFLLCLPIGFLVLENKNHRIFWLRN